MDPKKESLLLKKAELKHSRSKEKRESKPIYLKRKIGVENEKTSN